MRITARRSSSFGLLEIRDSMVSRSSDVSSVSSICRGRRAGSHMDDVEYPRVRQNFSRAVPVDFDGGDSIHRSMVLCGTPTNSAKRVGPRPVFWHQSRRSWDTWRENQRSLSVFSAAVLRADSTAANALCKLSRGVVTASSLLWAYASVPRPVHPVQRTGASSPTQAISTRAKSGARPEGIRPGGWTERLFRSKTGQI